MQSTIVGLPSYTVRESKKAKKLRIKISLNGIEVIIPQGFDHKRIPEIVLSKRLWIEAAVQRFEAQLKLFKLEQPHQLPEYISLSAIAEKWHIEYHYTSDLKLALTEHSEQRLIVLGNIHDIDACKSALRQWIAEKAQSHLVPWLQTVSKMHQLPFGKTAIRGQKTRWASCSGYKTISINYRLLFLPQRLVDYVFIHELCHTVHLDHSQRFWNLVGEKDPSYKLLNSELRDAWRNVPLWIGW